MRVCLVSNLYPPYVIGGAETMVDHIARGLRRAGCDVTILTSAPRARAGSETVDGITVLRIPAANLYWAGDAARQPRVLKPIWHAVDLWNPFMYRAVGQILAREKFDVIHTNNLGGLSPAVWSAARLRRIPIVHTPHDYALTCVRSTRMRIDGRTCWTPCIPCGVRGRWLRRLSRLVDAVVAPSHFVLDRHRELGFFPQATLRVIPWGLTLPPRPAAMPNVNEGVRFLYLGHLAQHKGVRVLLEAFTRVGAKTVALAIAGAGPLAGDCAAAAAADHRITFHGFVTGTAKDALLEACHALVFPSTCWETSGLVLQEAFAQGRPVVASRSGGVPEMVEDGVTAWLVDQGDAQGLAERMEALVLDPAPLFRASPECRARAERFTLDHTVEALLAVYERLHRS
jgi:glycosyltransferase involved in cell wall biosynthesis